MQYKDIAFTKQNNNIPTRGSSLLGSLIKSFRHVMSFVSPLFTKVKKKKKYTNKYYSKMNKCIRQLTSNFYDFTGVSN